MRKMLRGEDDPNAHRHRRCYSSILVPDGNMLLVVLHTSGVNPLGIKMEKAGCANRSGGGGWFPTRISANIGADRSCRGSTYLGHAAAEIKLRETVPRQ